MAVLVAGLAIYITIIVMLADYVPDHWAVKLVFFAVAGVAWALPLRGLLRWINRPDDAEHGGR